jgi:hypothetical protein
VSVQASALNLQPSVLTTNAWRTRTLAVILMVAIAGIFWVDSRSPLCSSAIAPAHKSRPAAFSRLRLFIRWVAARIFSGLVLKKVGSASLRNCLFRDFSTHYKSIQMLLKFSLTFVIPFVL